MLSIEYSSSCSLLKREKEQGAARRVGVLDGSKLKRTIMYMLHGFVSQGWKAQHSVSIIMLTCTMTMGRQDG